MKYRNLIENVSVFIAISAILTSAYFYIFIRKSSFQNQPVNEVAIGNKLLGQKIPFVKMISLRGKIFNPKLPNRKKAMIILFNPFDCSSCLDESKYWEMAYQRYSNPSFSVFAIADAPRKRDVELFAIKKNLSFEIYFDARAEIKRRLNLNISPIVLFIDSNAQIVHFHYSTAQFDEVKKLLQTVQLFAKKEERPQIR